MDELFLILKLTAGERLGGVSENSYNKLFKSIHDFYPKNHNLSGGTYVFRPNEEVSLKRKNMYNVGFRIKFNIRVALVFLLDRSQRQTSQTLSN